MEQLKFANFDSNFTITDLIDHSVAQLGGYTSLVTPLVWYNILMHKRAGKSLSDFTLLVQPILSSNFGSHTVSHMLGRLTSDKYLDGPNLEWAVEKFKISAGINIDHSIARIVINEFMTKFINIIKANTPCMTSEE